MIFLLSSLFLVSGCGDDERDQVDVIVEPLLLDIPVIERGTSSGSFDGEILDVRIADGLAEYLRNGTCFVGEGPLHARSPGGIHHTSVSDDNDTNYEQFIKLWSVIIENEVPAEFSIFGSENFDHFRDRQKISTDLPRPIPPTAMKWMIPQSATPDRRRRGLR